MSVSRRPKVKSKTGVVAVALTWDGARLPTRSLPVKAQEFLAWKGIKISAPPAKAVSKLFVDDQVRELRICWVPRLKGGTDVLAETFPSLDGKRLALRAVRTMLFGDVLGVVYRKRKGIQRTLS